MRNERDAVVELFNSKFNLKEFINFTQSLFKGNIRYKKNLEFSPKIKREFNTVIESFLELGLYKDSNRKTMTIVIVKLKKEESIARSRTIQRNFVKDYFLKGGIDSALVVFYNENSEDWRLSFIKLDYSYKNSKLEEEITPAKRFSFLLGKNENHHTAVERFLPLLSITEIPTIEDFEDTFNIEIVTKEFFEKYCDLYLTIKNELDNQSGFEEIAKGAQIRSDEFAKKLMGQLVFLYFLQKKGWLGVEANPSEISRDKAENLLSNKSYDAVNIFEKVYRLDGNIYLRQSEVINSLSNNEIQCLNNIFINTIYDAKWGSGDKNFIRSMFIKANNSDKNFFRDYLEPIFYNALNDKRGGDTYFKYLNCKIPFLNGGLFQPISDSYDYKNASFSIDNRLFSNTKKTKQGDIGDGVLDIFDRYAFTIKEDEPLEKEVAVDPEMLGKVFENLLDITDRKKKGAFYTPREIVHYMCQESLINYLMTEIMLSYDEAEALIRYGDIITDIDTSKSSIGAGDFKMPLNVRKQAKLIDNALENVKIADPAVGSGAFPLGMVNEIVRARMNLTYYILDDLALFNSNRAIKDRTPYELKLKTIRRCIHAVDIERSAVDITKLRLWLALVVEENDFRNIKALPNLDYNIMVGNSLIEEFEGVKLFNENILKGKTDSSDRRGRLEQLSLLTGIQRDESLLEVIYQLEKRLEGVTDKIEAYNLQKDLEEAKKAYNETAASIDSRRESDYILDKIYNLQEKFFDANSKDEKISLKKSIDNLEWLLIEKTVKENDKEELLEKIKEFKRTNTKPYFLWKLNFARVFKEKEGFDIVIGNPPYIGFHNVPDKEYFKEKYYSANGKYDFYVLFIEKGMKLLKENGAISYICPSYFYKRNYGKNIRKLILDNMAINYITDFQDSQMFESALTYTCIFMASKLKDRNKMIKIVDKNLSKENLYYIKQSELKEPLWNLENTENNKILESIKGRCNYTLENITTNISQGIVTGNNSVFCLSEQLIKERNISMKFLKPIFKGKDIRGGKIIQSGECIFYPYKYVNNSMVLISEEYIKEHDNSLYQYLLENKETLLSREYFTKSNKKWYELWNPRKKNHFEKKKFVFSELNNHNDFVVTEECFYSDSACGMELKEEYKKYYEYLNYYLNSNIVTYYFSKITVPKANGYFVYKNAFLSKLPVYLPENLNNVDYENFEKWLCGKFMLEID